MTPISRPAGQNAPNEGVDGTDTGRTVGGGSLNGPNQRLSHVPSTSHQRRVLAPRRGDRAPLHDRYTRLFLPQGGWQFRRAVARGHRDG